MSKVLQRFHHCFNHQSTTTAKFSSLVYVPFIPDEMIVTSVAYSGINGSEVEKNIYVWCNNINNNIALIIDLGIYSPRSTFSLGNSINGLWSFELRKIDGSLVNSVQTGKELSIMVEFIKYQTDQ